LDTVNKASNFPAVYIGAATDGTDGADGTDGKRRSRSMLHLLEVVVAIREPSGRVEKL